MRRMSMSKATPSQETPAAQKLQIDSRVLRENSNSRFLGHQVVKRDRRDNNKLLGRLEVKRGHRQQSNCSKPPDEPASAKIGTKEARLNN